MNNHESGKAAAILIAVILVLLGIAPAYSITGQEDREKKPRKASESGADARAEKEKQSYEKRIEERLAELDKKIRQLEAKTREQTITMKAEFDDQMKNFRRMAADAQRKLGAIRTSSGQAWTGLKSGMEAALSGMERSYERARSCLR